VAAAARDGWSRAAAACAAKALWVLSREQGAGESPGARRLARELGLEDSVAIPGLVESAYAYLERADVYCLPSRYEQSGALALLEALQAGAAIVASGCDGIPEDVADGEDALLVPPGDAVRLATALRMVLTDPSLRERLGRGARETFSRRFSGDAFARELAAIYAEFGMTA